MKTKVTRRRRLRVGLLGGSFNPAHAGHIHISNQALIRLQLDEVWWLVSPQNPLKSKSGMASYSDRISYARSIIPNSRINVSDLEKIIGTRYTSDTIEKLKHIYPKIQFIWIMGADLMPEVSDWKNWSKIFQSVPVAVFDRWPYASKLLASKTAKKFENYRFNCRSASLLANSNPPAWIYLFCPLNSVSAKSIRHFATEN